MKSPLCCCIALQSPAQSTNTTQHSNTTKVLNTTNILILAAVGAVVKVDVSRRTSIFTKGEEFSPYSQLILTVRYTTRDNVHIIYNNHLILTVGYTMRTMYMYAVLCDLLDMRSGQWHIIYSAILL
jgi:hypothetical protein